MLINPDSINPYAATRTKKSQWQRDQDEEARRRFQTSEASANFDRTSFADLTRMAIARQSEHHKQS